MWQRGAFLILIISLTFCSVDAKIRKAEKEGFSGRRIRKFPFYIYSNKKHVSYFAISGYLGDVPDIVLRKVKDPYTFKTCIKISYQPTYGQDHHGWAGIFWQWPPNNWGNNDKGGYNLKGAKFLYFFARGKDGDEIVEFKVGGVKGPYGDSDEASTGVISLTKEWKLYKIDLREKDLSNIIGGFAMIIQAHVNPDGITFYLNDIYYTKKTEPEPIFFKEYLKDTKKKKKR